MSRSVEPQTQSDSEGAFTLLELLVVLVILATLARTAILSVDGLVDQERRLSTARSLDTAREAILGRSNALDPTGHIWAEGFVSDIGRLPSASSGDPADQLSELWQRPDSITAFGLQSAPGDPQVLLPVGWRGPYLQLPLGQDGFSDGWGRSFRMIGLDGAEAVSDAPIGGLSSLGLDGKVGGEGYDQDLELILSDAVFSRDIGLVPVRVTAALGGGDTIVIRLYGPANGAITTLAQQSATAAASATTPFLFAGVPIGHRAIRAYQFDGPMPGPNKTLSSAIVSEVVPIVVVPGGIPEVVIDLGGS